MVDLDDAFNKGMDTITFGAWSAASMAFQNAKDKVDEIADGVAQFANKAQTLMSDLDSVLYDADKLLKIKQYQSRNYTELSPDEKLIFDKYWDQETADVKNFTGGASDNTSLEKLILEYSKKDASQRKLQLSNYLLANQILDLRKAKREMLMNKPGVVPETLSNVKTILEKVKTVDQPLVEKSLNGVNNVLADVDAVLRDADEAIRQATPGITGILEGTGNMLQAKRIVPRKLAELSDDELAYVNDLWDRNMEMTGRRLEIQDELAKLKASGAHDQQTQDAIDRLTAEAYFLMRECDSNDKEVQRVLLAQPGVIPGTIASVGHLIREVTPPVTSALEGIDSLLTIKRTAPRDASELNDEEQKYLAALQKHEKELDDMIKVKQDEIDLLTKSGATDQQTKDRIDYLTWELGNIKKAWESNYREIVRVQYTQPGVIPETIYGLNLSLRRFNMVEQPKIESIMDSVDDSVDGAAEVMAQVRGLFVVKTLEPVLDPALKPADKARLDGLLEDLRRIELNLQNQRGILATMPVPGTSTATPVSPLSGIAGKPLVLADGGIPSGANVIGMNTAATGFRRSDMLLDNQNAYLKQLDRERLKVGQQIERIRFREVDKPGVVPQIMAGLQATIERVNKEEQPRLEKILDNANGSLEHARGILGNVEDLVGKGTGLANQYSFLVKIGLALAGVGIVATLVLIPILLIRMILFGL
jgi:hypothetical protein